ncbi:redoxin domain-containing protein [Halovenus sp. WSH3]|uniref:Redoxin domain-containing protein n=1 Tax=Halovenus carboxidivorans TaxID=2692199 RepID=A0A6B0SWZ6_9EURY|nr:redoxin domain-containing protein [Halovenus carboxidivorans]MXR50218.1 redoxin domain-containing protein [Halovenus carboxidivorans]
MVEIGQQAPDFRAPAFVGDGGDVVELVAEIDAHEAVVLLFAPADFVGPCTAEWAGVRDAGWDDARGLSVIGLSGDSLFSHAAYADHYDVPLPIVSDFHAGIAEQYDLLLGEWEGHRHIPARATVVIDGDWEIRAVERADPLADASPAPVERATRELDELGFDLPRPEVEYGAFG